MDQKTAIANAEKYANLVVSQLNPSKIVLFGSFAKGNWNDSSDIDIAVFMNSIDTDFLELSKTLNRLTRNIDTRIEPVLLRNGDDNSGFMSSILKSGITLFQNS